ncbi:hypothetical protein RCH08_001610 [Janthinobacterium sp. CG_S6]|nr:hypothetical protein [Janthinobacterium sp. CG_S6]
MKPYDLLFSKDGLASNDDYTQQHRALALAMIPRFRRRSYSVEPAAAVVVVPAAAVAAVAGHTT